MKHKRRKKLKSSFVLSGAELFIKLAGQTNTAKGNKWRCWRENIRWHVSQMPECHRLHGESGLGSQLLSAGLLPALYKGEWSCWPWILMWLFSSWVVTGHQKGWANFSSLSSSIAHSTCIPEGTVVAFFYHASCQPHLSKECAISLCPVWKSCFLLFLSSWLKISHEFCIICASSADEIS